MSYTKKLEFGNFTLKFGKNKVLLDFFEEIVEPSFKARKHLRKIEGKGEYFFLETSKTKIADFRGTTHPAIVGKIVKNTKLKREQIFQDNNIVLDKKNWKPPQRQYSFFYSRLIALFSAKNYPAHHRSKILNRRARSF